MSVRKSLSTFAMAGVLALSIAPAALAQCPGNGIMTDRGCSAAPSSAERPVLEGQVAAVDHESGRLILETEKGFVALQASPAEVDGLEVGDVVTVSLLDEDERE